MDNRELDAWLAEHLWGSVPCEAWSGFFQGAAGTQYVRVEEACPHGPNGCYHPNALAKLSTTGDGMLGVIAAMKEGGWHVSISSRLRAPWYSVTFHEFLDPDDGKSGRAESSDLRNAVALAAKATLEGEKSDAHR